MLRKTLKLQSISTPWLKSSFLPALAQSSFYLNASFNKPLHNSTPQYLFSNHHHNPHGHHGHGHHQHSSECSHNHTYTGPFEEKSFMNHFLHLSSHRSSNMKQEFFDLFKLLRENIDKIRNPNSAVALLHKVQLFDEYIDANLQKKILDQAIKNFSERYTVASDNGDLLRAAVLVVALQKLKNEHFFKIFFNILLNNVQSFSFPNLLTTLESFTYNKWLNQVANNDQTINILNVLSAKLQVRELAYFAKYSNLLYYLVRNTFLDKNSAQAELLRGQIENDVNKLYDVILQLIVNDRNSKSLDLFAMTDAYISLDVFNQIFPKLKGKHVLLTKYYDTMVNAYLPKNFELGNVKYNLLTVVTFLKRYYVVPPQKVHPQFLSFINQVFLKHYNDREFRSLENYNYFLLFLVKTDGLKVPEKLREEINIQDLILQERNLFVLAKTLEFFAFCEQANKNYFYHDKRELQTLEKVIFQIIGRLPKKTAPSPALLQIFQLLVALNKGNNEDWKNLLTIFNNKEGLNRLDYLELIIKLVPAGAVRTKTLYKVYSNITLSETSHNLKGVELDPELTQMLEKFWNNLEEILVEKANRIYADKWPIILFNFVYANIFKDNYKKLYQIARPKLLGNLHTLDPKQLSEIVYSYSRVSEKADDLLFAIAKKVFNEKLYEKMSDVEVCNLYWAYANAGIWVEDLSNACEGRLFKMIKDLPLESYTQFCQALSINNKKLSAEEFDALNKYTIDLIEKLSRQKGGAVNIQNILGICNSFNILQNFGNKQVWETLLEFLLAKRDLYASNPLFMHYIYKLYIHLTAEGLKLAQKDALFDVIQANYRGVVDYIKNNKKHIVSKFEKMVRTNIEQNLGDLFGPGVQQRQGDEVITLHRGPSHDLLLVNDVTRIDDAIKQKKLPNLGARELLVPYTVDIFIGDYAIEVNGPLHYLRDEQGRLKENGYNALKRILLEKSKMKYIEVPYTLNANRNTEDANEIYRYLKSKIAELK